MTMINVQRIRRDLSGLVAIHRKKLPYVIASTVVLFIYLFSRAHEVTTYIYKTEGKLDFKDAKVLGSQSDSIYEGKERLFSKTVKEVMSNQEQFKDTLLKLQARLDEMDKNKTAAPTEASVKDAPKQTTTNAQDPKPIPNSSTETKTQGKEIVQAGVAADNAQMTPDFQAYGLRSSRRNGTPIISFPVKEAPLEKPGGVVLPAGSYVKGKLMTGVEAPEGRTYPVLLQLDYAYIIPNNKKVDLSGCFMIAKSQGSLSTERVEMQASKLSCVSKDGKMFERDVNGFVADDKDNSFAVMGSVNSKQDRVAAVAFLSSVVEGVGKAIQQAQTTQSVNPLGGSSGIVTGNQAAFLGAGGASNAAGLVTQWYLRQAENLLPTINVGSGQDVWVVMQEMVKLPTEYFKKNAKGGNGESVYSYFTRIAD